MERKKRNIRTRLEVRQYESLCRPSRQERKNILCIIRDRIMEAFAPSRSPWSRDPLWEIVGLGVGDGTPVARAHDRYLY